MAVLETVFTTLGTNFEAKNLGESLHTKQVINLKPHPEMDPNGVVQRINRILEKPIKTIEADE